MAIKDQFKTLKENWLIIVLVFVIMLAFVFLGDISRIASYNTIGASEGYYRSSDSLVYDAGYKEAYYPGSSSDFAPQVLDRKITKTANLNVEVAQGSFTQKSEQVKNVVSEANGFVLSENVNKYDVGKRSYYNGYYTIKVGVDNYESVVYELKEVGEVLSFQESSTDITGRYTDLSQELASEKARLERFEELYKQTTSTNEKITLADKLFDQERRVAMLEDLVKNVDNRVAYSTIQFTLAEKRADYYDVTFVRFSQLVKALIQSINSLLYLIFVVGPYALLGLMIWGISKIFRRK